MGTLFHTTTYPQLRAVPKSWYHGTMPEGPAKEKQSVEEFLNSVLRIAVQSGASDVHFEPMKDEVNIRMRIDGALEAKTRLPHYEYEHVLNRIKVLSNLDLASRGLPQEGHFEILTASSPEEQLAPPASSQTQAPSATLQEEDDKGADLFFDTPDKDYRARTPLSPPEAPSAPVEAPSPQVQQKPINVRVSIFPTINGSTTVLRLLNRDDLLRRLDDMEMDAEVLATYRRLVSKTYGMVLITGPAGSGKTTTLYATLQELKGPTRNIITLEDPVEFSMPEMRQTQIIPERGLTFAVGMRSILRQDPDALMIGEIRDSETAEYAVRAALVGRVILSTIHSNTTIGTIARLIDMGIERSLIAYALNGVMARRLVRRLCNGCQTSYTPLPQYLAHFGLNAGQHSFVKGKGCDACHGTGFNGRIGLFEVLELDDKLRTLIVERSPMGILQEYMERTNVKMLKQDAIQKILAGLTTIEEAAKAV